MEDAARCCALLARAATYAQRRCTLDTSIFAAHVCFASASLELLNLSIHLLQAVMSESKALARPEADTVTRCRVPLLHVAMGLLLAITTASVVLNSLTFAKMDKDACDFDKTRI